MAAPAADFDRCVDYLDGALVSVRRTISIREQDARARSSLDNMVVVSGLLANYVLPAMLGMREILRSQGTGATSDFPDSPPGDDFLAEWRRLASDLGPLVYRGRRLVARAVLTPLRIAEYLVDVGTLQRRLEALKARLFGVARVLVS